MQRYRPVRAVARLFLPKNAPQHAYHAMPPAAAPSPVRAELADDQSELSVAYERRIQEMYQAAAPPELEPRPAVAQQQLQRNLPSPAEVADRLNSHKSASCSSSVSTADSNTGIDWREALTMLQAAEKQQLQQNMLTDTFRCCLPTSFLFFATAQPPIPTFYGESEYINIDKVHEARKFACVSGGSILT